MKHDLEAVILRAIYDFHMATGLIVDDIRVDSTEVSTHGDATGKHTVILNGVEVIVKPP